MRTKTVESSRLGEERIRAFIAVDTDEPKLQAAIQAIQQDLRNTGADLKLVEPQNVHITLRFLGELPRQTLEQVKETILGLKFRPFECDFTGLGAFPNLNRVNVVWIGIRDGAKELELISENLESGLRNLGFQPDRKGFNPHVTLARVRTGRNKSPLATYIASKRDDYFARLPVSEVRLKRSTLTPSGPIYSTLHSVRAET